MFNNAEKLTNSKSTHTNRLLALAITSIAMIGCSDSSDDPVVDTSTPNAEDTSYTTSQIDASSYTDYVYLNLLTGEEVSLSAEEAASSSEWHIGLRRTSVIVNGGDSGSANVAAALAASQDDFYDSDEANINTFLNTSAEDEEEHLTANYDISSLTFSADEIVPAIQGSGAMKDSTTMDLGWYNYNLATHQTSLNSDNWWLLRSSTSDSYAKFHATSYDRSEGLAATFEFDVQAKNTSQFAGSATFTASIPATGGEVCFDFDADTNIDCSSPDWDVKLEYAGRSITLWTNSGVSGEGSGGAWGPFDAEAIAEYTAGDSHNGTNITRHYNSDATEGVFSEQTWYAYSLEGNHKLWPNYRTYIVDTNTEDTDAPKYKLQIIDYYSDLDVSGFPTIRYEANVTE